MGWLDCGYLIVSSFYISNIYILLRSCGDFNQAMKYLKQGLALCEEINSYKTPIILATLLGLTIEMDSYKAAQECLEYIKKFTEQRDKKNLFRYDIYDYDMYDLSEALVLKKSPNDADNIRARELLKKILKKDEVDFEIKFYALLNLCDLLLVELHQTNNIKILDDINLYLQKLFDIAKEQKSYWLLVESYLLEVKFDLITLDLKKAQETLTKAQEIAEKNNMNQFVKRISIEQKNLQDQTDKWFKLKNSDNSIIKLTNLTSLKEQIRYMLQKRETFKRLNI